MKRSKVFFKYFEDKTVPFDVTLTYFDELKGEITEEFTGDAIFAQFNIPRQDSPIKRHISETVSLKFPSDYPLLPPIVSFSGNLKHELISNGMLQTCGWNPIFSLRILLMEIYCIILESHKNMYSKEEIQ